MNDLNLRHNAKYRKCAKIAGDTSGNYHPHGESVIYPTLVRMAQPFRLRHCLIDGQGNFGSIDGDPPAAMRYTEARMGGPAEEMLVDLDKDTTDKRTNYDETRTEPTVLPGKFPNLLVNGSEGIAVGMSTALPPHNLQEVINAIRMVLDNPKCTVKDLLTVITGPDFPTGGIICGRAGIAEAFKTGRGKITLRGRIHHEEPKNGKGRNKIVFTEIPYEREKTAIIEKIADEVKSERIEGIYDIRDESDRDGMRVVIELKKDGDPIVIENLLYKYTPLQTTYAIRNTALIDGQPRTLTLKELIEAFRDHRFEVIRRRTQFLLNKAQARLHILEGLMIAIKAIDEVVEIIKASANTADARETLEATFSLTPIQSQAIVDMRLGRLTGLEVVRLQKEIDDLIIEIAWLKRLLAEDELVFDIIREDLTDIESKYAEPRRTTIGEGIQDFLTEDLITEETMVVTISSSGYIKRTAADTYRAQARGGRGITGGKSKDGDVLSHLFVCSTHDYLLVFTDRGRLFWLKVYRLPQQDRTSKGRSIRNLIEGIQAEEIRSVIATRNFDEGEYLLFATEQGKVKKTELSAYSRPRNSGLIATKLNDDDRLIGTRLVSEGDHVMIITAGGQVVRFDEGDARPMGRNAAGVKGAKLKGSDRVVDLVAGNADEYLLIACENGYGKRTKVGEFRLTKRGSQGVVGIKANARNGPVVNARNASRCEDVLFSTASGMLVRTKVEDISIQGRATQGVRLVNLKDDDKLIALAAIPHEQDDESTDEAATE